MSTEIIAKPKLVNADFRVCCNHSDRRVCVKTVDAIRNHFNNIVELTATQPYAKVDDMCVIGTAIIDPQKKIKFQRDLKRLKITTDGTRVIKKAIVEIVQ